MGLALLILTLFAGWQSAHWWLAAPPLIAIITSLWDRRRATREWRRDWAEPLPEDARRLLLHKEIGEIASTLTVYPAAFFIAKFAAGFF